MSNNTSSSSGSSSSSDTPEPTPGGSARTTPFELQSTIANAVAARQVAGFRNFAFPGPMSSGGNPAIPANLANQQSNNVAIGSMMPR